jgi:hypothetical protein
MSAKFDNKAQKYSPGSSGEFSNVLKRNLLVSPSFGYQMLDADVTTITHAVTNYKTLYHTKIFSNTIISDVASASSYTVLPNVTDSWATYDSETYDDSTYTPEGYWLSSVIDFADPFNSLKLTKITMTSTSDNIYVYYRMSDIKDQLDDNTDDFTYLDELANGSNVFALPNIKERYFQFCIVFDTGVWGSGAVSGISIEYETFYEYFNAGQFLVDKPNWSSSFGNYDASISCRDKFKKSLETKITSPSYSVATYATGVDIGKILRDTADRCGMLHNDGTELIADTGYKINIADDDNFKDEKASDIFNEVLTYLNFKNVNYRLELNSDGYLQLVIKDSTINNVDWVLDYKSNLINLSKSEESDNLLQRITILSKSHNTDAEIELASQTYNSVQTNTDLTWSNEAIYKRIEVTVNSGDGVFSLAETHNTKIVLNITGTSINVTVKVYGCELVSSPPFVGESIYYSNAENYDGITFKIENRLAQSDADCRNMAKALTDRYGSPSYAVSATIPFNPLLELGDRVLIIEKYTYTNTIYRVDGISLTYNASGASCYQSLTLTDLGSDLTDFNWDRHNVLNGGESSGVDDINYDESGIWDYDLFLQDTDTNDYEHLRNIKF